MRTPRLAFTLFALAGLAMAVGCGDDATEPSDVAGTLRLQLVSPHTDDGAILLEIGGGDLDQLQAVNPSHSMHSRAVGSLVRVVIVGSSVAGDLLEWDVPDVRAADSYTARVIEVADQRNQLRSRLADYDLVIARAGG